MLPFVRPETRATTLVGHPGDVRKQHAGIAPGGHRTARYRVAGDLLTGKGPYRVVAKLRYQAVPVNLIHTIQRAGWDYGLNAREVADRVIAGGDVIRQVEATIAVDGVRQ